MRRRSFSIHSEASDINPVTSVWQDTVDMATPVDQIWYASYGSNMSLRRLNYYLVGGRPPAGALTYPGCRDNTPPRQSVAIMMPGEMYFAMDALAWSGGMAFYDPDEVGEIPARAHLISVAQFADIAAQEMCTQPGADLDLSAVLAGERVALGGGCYETMLCAGSMNGISILTFTAPWRSSDARLNSPSPIYIRHLAAGLIEGHDWSIVEIAAYLSSRPGAVGKWTQAAIIDLISDLA